MLALELYWGKLTVRNFRGGNGDAGIIRSPARAIALLDLCDAAVHPANNQSLPNFIDRPHT
jgi:hypothetical protein